MSKINIVIPVVKSNKFTGGPLCILEHAAQLTARGHDVRVIPVLPSPYPKWFKKNMGDFISTKKTDTLKKSMKALFAAIKCIPSTKNESGKLKFIQHFGRFIENIGLTFPKFTPLSLRISLRIAHLREHMRDADITFATSYETALPTALTGTGKLFYFIQHYEPYFKTESIDPFLTEKESLLSYKLGFKLITNSQWLKKKIKQESNLENIAYCPNAINHEIFINKNNEKSVIDNNRIRIISYGGRDAQWKGFKEMAEAVNIARHTLPDIEIIWQVYGGALLPAHNDIAKYQDLGFLSQEQLATAYQNADILLSASWYESFPLFPLEAMACGLAVISTQEGTESFCIPGKTAEVVPARNPQAIAAAIINLIKNPSYRQQLSSNGNKKATTFTWKNAGNIMENIIHTQTP